MRKEKKTELSSKTERQVMIDDYIEKMNPGIRKSLDYNQNQEVSRLLNRILPKRGNHIVDIRFTFWFIKPCYFTLNFGIDRRDTKRVNPTNAYRTVGTIIVNALFLLLLGMLVLALLFLALYMMKTMLGIDIFPDKHLSDIIRNLVG
ncbi:MAG: hypothetical protein KAS49_00045 [Candidatus Cloacimonetes bacterium]|nr:hypothetical protein [Candidatus Cloacimonadota bacterium]